MSLLQQLKNNPFVCAPMAGITDIAFRAFIREMGSSFVITELVSASGIEYGGERTLKLMAFEDSQRPVGVQLFGESPEIVAKAARFCQEQGADFVDLNFGCPVSKVVKKGAGSAILKDLKAVEQMFRTVKSSLSIPLTVKIRTGWTYEQRNALELANIAYQEGLSWVAIHGRDRAQAYKGKADWEYIGEVKSKSKIPILGNGDILSGRQACERLEKYNLDGVMIGRGCLKNPWIFQDAMAIWQGGSPSENRDFMAVFAKLKGYLESFTDERLQQIQLKKFASWFSAGYPGSASFRKKLFQTKSVDHTLEEVQCFYQSLKGIQQADTSDDGFLMGGHG
tara:strand:- start:4864 stop:5874 length:1011 start_codon:yes stop_codon:yes gene_type:complete